ncbi:MAG: VanZ family protein [Alphaproteobacteria bacterium]
MGYQTDKMLHLFTFCIISTLATWKYLEHIKKLIASLCTLLCLGGIIELIQIFVPNRTAQIEDMCSNILGITLGIIIGYLLKTGYYAQKKPST